jgi:hypothetical protein
MRQKDPAMRPLIAIVFLALPVPAAALNVCDELWFARNQVFDHAGYCFRSALGRAVFDNSNCTSNIAEADPSEQAVVEQVLTLESEWNCDVDTSRKSLDIPNIQARNTMIDVPVPDGYESECIGWRGAPIALRIGRHPQAPISGVIQTGENILFSFISVDGWAFVTSPRGDADMGWMLEPKMTEASCDGFAG